MRIQSNREKKSIKHYRLTEQENKIQIIEYLEYLRE